jgi:integrase
MEIVMKATDEGSGGKIPWNKDRLIGRKPPLRLKEIWTIRIRLQLSARVRDLAMFNLAIDSKLRACDLTKLRVCDVCHGQQVASRATIMQQKTQRPVQFEITEQTRDSVEAWIRAAGLTVPDFLFPSRLHEYRISRRVSIHAWCIAGLRRSGRMTPRTARTRCVERFRRLINGIGARQRGRLRSSAWDSSRP